MAVASGTQMNLGVLVTPHINQQALNGMASSAGATFAARFNSSVNKASQPLGRITGQVSEFEKSMQAANARVLAFGASAGSIYLVHDAFRKMVSSTIEVEKALADINVVLGLGQSALKNFSSSMFKAAAETGQTFQTASKVALEFARHGVSATETTKRMASAMQLMRISGLSATQAVNGITAAINAFNREGLTSEDIINRMTAIDTKFAVSAQDLAKAIERVGSTAVDAGVKFNELLAMVTAVQTATSRGGAVIGNAFKSIFTRLSRPEVLSDLEAVGVAVRDSSGQVKPMIDIMRGLARQYDSLSFSQKSFITEAAGGVYQVNILKTMLSDLGRGFSIYDKAVIAAKNSTGLIEKRMESLNDTIASKLNASTLKITQLFASFGQTGFGAGAKKGLDSFNRDMDLLISGLGDSTDSDSAGIKLGKGLAQGIIKGLGDIVSGPGVQMAATLIARLTKGLAVFSFDAGREVLGYKDKEHKQKAIQQSINSFLQSNVSLVNAWAKGQLSLNNLSAIYLKNLQAANLIQARIGNLGKGAASVVGGGVSYNPTPAAGFIPSFSIASQDEISVERRLARAHGYDAGPVVRKVVWDGHGGAQLTAMNQRETYSERTVNGRKGSLITPPNGFGEGTIYASGGYVPNFSTGNILLAAKFYDALKVGSAKGISFGDNGIEKITREVFGGIGFSGSSIAQSHGLASAVRNPVPTTRLTNIAKEYGVDKAIIAPIVAPISVKAPLPLSMRSNEALLHQFLANHSNPESVIASFAKQGINIQEMLASHTGSGMDKIISSLLVSNKKLLYQSSNELKDRTLLDFFVPGGVKKHGPKEPFVFNTAIAHMTGGEFGVRAPGLHPSYPIVVKGHQGPSMKPIAAEEMFPNIRNNKMPLFFAANQAFGARILNIRNKGHKELLEKMGYTDEILANSGLGAATGFVPNFGLYHRDLGFPPAVRAQVMSLDGTTTPIIPSGHARQAVLDDIKKHGVGKLIPIPKKLQLNHNEIIEVEHDENARGFGGTNITKVVVRRKGSQGLDQVLAVLPSGVLKTVWHNDSNDVHKTLDASRYTPLNAASGYIPNFSMVSAIADAFRREGTPTAALGASPQLRSPSNPLGLGVYDSSYQRNLSDAFSQHRAMGQTNLKNMGAAGGFVPNFGVEASLIIGTLQGTINNLNSILAPLAFGYNKQLEAVRRLNVQYSTFTQTLSQGGKIEYRGKEYDASGGNIYSVLMQFVRDFKSQNSGFSSRKSVMSQTERNYQSYRENLAARQAGISRMGNYGMIAGPMASEMLAGVAKNFGAPDLSKSLEVFSSGITTVGQVLSAFPNKMGIGVAAGIGASTISNSVNIYKSGFGGLEKAFDLASTKAERMASAGNAVLESFERLRNASMDASLSIEDYKSIQDKHLKALSELSSVPNGGGDLARKLTTAASDKQMQTYVAEAVNAQNVSRNELRVRMNLAQAKSQSMFFGHQYQGVFDYSNDTEKLQKEQLLRDTSSQLMSSILDSSDLPEGLKDRMEKGSLSNSDLDFMKSKAPGNGVLFGLNESDTNLATKQFASDLEKFKIPDGVDPESWAKHLERLKQITVQETAIRERYNKELQNVYSKGAILANFTHQSLGGEIESDFRKKGLDTFRQGNRADLAALVTADVPMIQMRGKIKEQEIKDQMEHDLATHKNKGAESLSAAIAAAIKEYGSNNNKEIAGSQSIASFNPGKMNQLDYLSGRQKNLASNPNALVNLIAGGNYNDIAEAFIGKKKDVASPSGQGTLFSDHQYETIANKLATATSGQQENIASILIGTNQITEKGLDELVRLGESQVREIKEAKFKELTGAIKGIDELQRGGARKIRRELHRDEYIMAHSRNSIRRGEAARDLLNYIPSNERDYNNPYIKNLYDTASRGSRNAFNYIYSGSALSGFAHSSERADARTFGNYKGVNMPIGNIFGSGKEASPVDTKELQASVANAGSAIKNFANYLNAIGSDINSFKAKIKEMEDARKKEGASIPEVKSGGQTVSGDYSSPWKSGLANSGPMVIGAALSLAISAFALKGRGGAITAETMEKAIEKGMASAIASSKSASALNSAATASNISSGAKASAIINSIMGGATKTGTSATSSVISSGVTQGMSAARTIEKFAETIKKGGKAVLTDAEGRVWNDFSQWKGRNISGEKGIIESLKKMGVTEEALTPAKSLPHFPPNSLNSVAKNITPFTESAGNVSNVGRMARIGSQIKSVGASAASTLNPLSGWKDASKLGKAGKLLGAAGAVYGGVMAAKDFAKGDVRGGVEGSFMTAGSLVPGYGLAMLPAKIAGEAINADVNRFYELSSMKSTNAADADILERRKKFSTKENMSELRRIASLGEKATPDEQNKLKMARRFLGSNVFSRTEERGEAQRAAEFFQSRKSEIGKNAVAPVGTFASGSYIYGWNKDRTYSRIANKSDSADKIAQAEFAYNKKHTEERERLLNNLQKTQKGQDYLKLIDNYAEKMAMSQTEKRGESRVQGPRITEEQRAFMRKNEQVQHVIKAEPATVVVKYVDANGKLLETVITKLSFLESAYNTMIGTPKPALANNAGQ